MPFDPQAVRDALTARMFMDKLVENRWRGDLVEEIVRMVLESQGWQHCSADWKSWDFEHARQRLKMQVKQTARQQTWGVSPVTNRYGIGPAKGFYEDNVWKKLPYPQRLSEVYVFAHNPIEGDTANHWDARQWKFSVVRESELPNAKSISSVYVAERWKPVDIGRLDAKVSEVCIKVTPNGRTETANAVERPTADDAELDGAPT